MRPGDVLHPLCPLSRAWNTFMLAIMGVLLIVVPLKAGFLLDHWALDAFQVISSTILFMDIAITFVTGYQIGKTLDFVELDVKKVVYHYTTTWLLFDVVLSLPWRLLTPQFLGNHWVVTTPEILNAMPILALMRTPAIMRRSSFFSYDIMQIKYSKRAIISFVVFILVCSLPT